MLAYTSDIPGPTKAELAILAFGTTFVQFATVALIWKALFA